MEEDLERLMGIKVDFEIGDAVAKLERFGLVMRDGEKYAAVPIAVGLEKLDYAWDNFFKYNKASLECSSNEDGGVEGGSVASENAVQKV